MKHYLALAVRILAIALLLYSISNLGQFLQFYSIKDFTIQKPNIILASLNFILPFFLAVIFWVFPKLVTKKIYNGDEEAKLESMPLLAAIIAGSGTFYFYYAFTDAWYWLIVFSTFGSGADIIASQALTNDYTASIWVTGIELILSLILIFKCKSLAKFIAKVAK